MGGDEETFLLISLGKIGGGVAKAIHPPTPAAHVKRTFMCSIRHVTYVLPISKAPCVAKQKEKW